MAFQDGYPVHVTTSASLDRLNEWIAAGPRADEGNLPMIRFRPNVVVSGDLDPFAEDGWRTGADRRGVLPAASRAATAARYRPPIT